MRTLPIALVNTRVTLKSHVWSRCCKTSTKSRNG
jgi:hypothetical protein